MKQCDISGGGTKIVGLFGALEGLEEDFDVYSGVSSGAILAFVTVASSLPKTEIKKRLFSFSLEEVFTNPPLGRKGGLSLTAISRIVTGKTSLAKQDKLVLTLKELVTEDDFYIWKQYGKNCYVGAVNYEDGSRVIINLKDLHYNEALTLILGSSSLPIVSEYVELELNGKKLKLMDGGVRNHSIGYKVAKLINATEVISIFSRPEDYKCLTDYNPTSLIDVFMRTYDIISIELSKKDEDLLKELENTKVRIYYLPYRTSNTFEMNPEILNQLYQDGLNATKNPLS